MTEILDIINPLHKKTTRNYIHRMNNEKVRCAIQAKQYEFDYWDGEKCFGYGGYNYIEGRWHPVAKKLIERYNLTNQSKILEVGCGKGYLLYEIKNILTNIEVRGFDISKYAIANSKQEIQPFLFNHRAQDAYSFSDKEFDLIISLNTLHNLRIFELKRALQEFMRVGKQQYLVVESYRNEQELFNLECWALTAESFFDHEEWIWLFNEFKYFGDYEFIYFE